LEALEVKKPFVPAMIVQETGIERRKFFQIY
jgi:hypothetical protein